MSASTDIRSQLQTIAVDGKLPHALLLHGTATISEVDSLVVDIASTVMQLPPKKRARASELLLSAGHPDFLYISPTIGSATSKQKPQISSQFGSIKIDQVKQILPFLVPATPFEAKARIIYIKFADTLTISAQNQILKSLEEPSNDTYFILYSPKKRSVLHTILSRTIHIYIPASTPENHALPLLFSSRLGQTVLSQLTESQIDNITNRIDKLSSSILPQSSPLAPYHLIASSLHKTLAATPPPSTLEKSEISQFSNQLLKLILLMFAQKIAFRYNRASMGIIDLLQQPQLISSNAMIFTAASLIGRELKGRR
ncbi:hypothetical protein KAH37_09210 [bacterium]|nr:hypothetical protein [bacterium]